MNKPMRRLPLAAAMNTRDLGGYPCAGGSTNWGVFLRSDNLRKIEPEDLLVLKAYGVTTTLDLRSNQERQAHPSVLELAEGFVGHHVTMSDQIHAVNFEGDLPGSMSGLYISLLDNSRAEICEAVQILANAEGAALFHCAVGKDRTGVVAMLLLKLAGVDDTDIVADYAVTDIYMHELFEGMPKELNGHPLPEAVVRSRPASMWRTLAHLAEAYGTAEAYLLECGVEQEDIERLREKFVSR